MNLLNLRLSLLAMKKTFFVVDVGNTRTKAAYFVDNELCQQFSSLDKIAHFVANNPIDFSLICSVADEEKTQAVQQILPQAIRADWRLRQTINTLYKTPKTLGMDRLANVLAGSFLYPNQHVLVVDIGTCLKFDFIDKMHNYHGGSISPGLGLRFKSLNDYTAQLPLIKKHERTSLIGQSTKESLLSGVINGMENEIFGMIERYRKEYREITLIITGGDAKIFDLAIKNNIFAHENLTLLGLKLMLEVNVR